MQSSLAFLKDAEAQGQVGSAVAVRRRRRRRPGDDQALRRRLRQRRARPDVPALIFDCDGVLADTERDGHLPAFNDAFAEFGLPIRWDEATYAREAEDRRRQGADRQSESATTAPSATDADQAAATPARPSCSPSGWTAGLLPGRPGIHRLIGDVLGRGWTVAVASTSAEPSVRAVLRARRRRRAGRHAATSSPATSSRRRSRRPTST